MTVTLKIPSDADRPDWERLYRGYAEFYGMPMADETLDTVWSWIQHTTMEFYGLLARSDDGSAIGLMHFRAMPSPLRGAKVGFLDDLYVDPNQRGSGAVDAMFDALKAEAKQHGWPFVRWITKDDNYRARAVYDRLATRTDWVTYQLTPN